MLRITLEEWQLLAESPVPGWQAVEELARTASASLDAVGFAVLGPASDGSYRRIYGSAPPWSEDVEHNIRRALRRDAYVAILLQDRAFLKERLPHYRRVKKAQIGSDALALELGGRLLGIEELLREAPLLVLAGHDGDPVFVLSEARAR